MANTTHERLIAAILTLARVHAIKIDDTDDLSEAYVDHIFLDILNDQLEMTKRDRHE